MPWTVLMISSSGLVTLVSISSGDAPRKVVVTVMIGSSTLGNWSTPMLRKENHPRTTSRRLIMVAKTGRLMQRFASPIPLASSGTAGAGRSGALINQLERKRFAFRLFLDAHPGPFAQFALT